MERITPEQVVEAYKATGLKPARFGYFPDDGCACALGVLAYQTVQAKTSREVVAWLSSTFNDPDGDCYDIPFARGFDGSVPRDYQNHEAFLDGQAAWKAVVDAGLVTVSE